MQCLPENRLSFEIDMSKAFIRNSLRNVCSKWKTIFRRSFKKYFWINYERQSLRRIHHEFLQKKKKWYQRSQLIHRFLKVPGGCFCLKSSQSNPKRSDCCAFMDPKKKNDCNVLFFFFFLIFENTWQRFTKWSYIFQRYFCRSSCGVSGGMLAGILRECLE